MSKWSDFYVKRMNEVYIDHLKNKYNFFIKKIKISIELNSDCRIIELGCGAANITKIISEIFPTRFFAISDFDKDMLKLAKKNINKNIFITHNKAQNQNITEKDITHSHGVLEHLSDQEIKDWIYNERFAKASIHYVPSNKYKTPSFGDERLLAIKEWKELTGYKVLSFNNGFDLILLKNS